jgi:VanZ family protein
VRKLWQFTKLWGPVLVWISIIFAASSDAGSFQHTSRILVPLVRWLFPHLSEEAVHAIVVTIRKGAHLSEYAVLAALLWRALRSIRQRDPVSWSWPRAGSALGLAALYAATDEFHQTFVPSRQGSVWDVLLDTGGACLGLMILWGIGRCRKHLPDLAPLSQTRDREEMRDIS